MADSAQDHNTYLLRMAMAALTVKGGGQLTLTERDLQQVPDGSLAFSFGDAGELVFTYVEQKQPGLII